MNIMKKVIGEMDQSIEFKFRNTTTLEDLWFIPLTIDELITVAASGCFFSCVTESDSQKRSQLLLSVSCPFEAYYNSMHLSSLHGENVFRVIVRPTEDVLSITDYAKDINRGLNSKLLEDSIYPYLYYYQHDIHAFEWVGVESLVDGHWVASSIFPSLMQSLIQDFKEIINNLSEQHTHMLDEQIEKSRAVLRKKDDDIDQLRSIMSQSLLHAMADISDLRKQLELSNSQNLKLIQDMDKLTEDALLQETLDLKSNLEEKEIERMIVVEARDKALREVDDLKRRLAYCEKQLRHGEICLN